MNYEDDICISAPEALQAATINPAGFLGMDKTLGTIEEGKIADLVLLKHPWLLFIAAVICCRVLVVA